MRGVLALILCGNRICEVITATLGPLLLGQLPKSKPVTPYAVFTDDTHPPGGGNPPDPGCSSVGTHVNAPRAPVIPRPGFQRPRR